MLSPIYFPMSLETLALSPYVVLQRFVVPEMYLGRYLCTQ